MGATVISKEGSLELLGFVIPGDLSDGLSQSKIRKADGLCTSENQGERHRDPGATQDNNWSPESCFGGSKKAEALRFLKLPRTVHTLSLLAAGTKISLLHHRQDSECLFT